MLNENIKELAKKSGATFLQSSDGKVEYIDYNQTFFDMGKFAELIAKECFAAALQASRGHINPSIMIEEFEKRLGFKVTLPNSRNNSTT